MIHEWLTDEPTLKEWGFTADTVKQDTAKYIQEAAKLSERLFENFYECLRDYEQKTYSTMKDMKNMKNMKKS